MYNLGIVNNIGEAWLRILKEIKNNGKLVDRDDESYIEIKGLSVSILKNDKNDSIVENYQDNDMYIWMKENFTHIKQIKELGNANSYGERLYNYCNRKNQIEYVIGKIRKNNFTRAATITTLEPLTDISYIPCISMLDFDVVDKKLDLYVYARAIDFGKKGVSNLICLFDVLKHVANKTDLETGVLHMYIKSAHVYKQEYDKMQKITKSN